MKAEREAAAQRLYDSYGEGGYAVLRARERAAMVRALREAAEYAGALDPTLAAELRNPGTFDLDALLDSDEP